MTLETTAHQDHANAGYYSLRQLVTTRGRRVGMSAPVLPFSESTLTRMIDRGDFPKPVFLPGTRIRVWTKGSVHAWLRAQQIKTEIAPAIIDAASQVQGTNVPRMHSRMLADVLGMRHDVLMHDVENNRRDLARLGPVEIETAKRDASLPGRPSRFVQLNERQAFLLLLVSRNQRDAMGLKLGVVAKFFDGPSPEDGPFAFLMRPGVELSPESAAVLFAPQLQAMVGEVVDDGTASRISGIAALARTVAAGTFAEAYNELHDSEKALERARDHLRAVVRTLGRRDNGRARRPLSMQVEVRP